MMNLLKKLAACGLSLTMILSLAACGGTDDTSSGESGGEPVKYLIQSALGTDRLLCRRNPRRPHASQPTVG